MAVLHVKSPNGTTQTLDVTKLNTLAEHSFSKTVANNVNLNSTYDSGWYLFILDNYECWNGTNAPSDLYETDTYHSGPFIRAATIYMNVYMMSARDCMQELYVNIVSGSKKGYYQYRRACCNLIWGEWNTVLKSNYGTDNDNELISFKYGSIGSRGRTHDGGDDIIKQIALSTDPTGETFYNSSGGKLALHQYDPDNNGDGGFHLFASDGTNNVSLQGKPDGYLSWSGARISLNNGKGNIWWPSAYQPDNPSVVDEIKIMASSMRSTGENWEESPGAKLALRGNSESDSRKGEFSLLATDGTNKATLNGRPDGKLIWNGSFNLTGTTSVPLILNIDGTGNRDIQTFSTDGNHRIGLIRMSKDSNGNCIVTIGASNTSNDAPIGIGITRGATGDPSINAVTPAASDNSTKIATTAYVKANVPASVGNANTPVYTDSNGKIVSTGKSFANYATLASPALTGTPTAPTASVSTDSTQIATTAYVKDCVPKSIGGTQRPVYTNSNGVITACNATGSTGGLEGINIGISSANNASYIRYESGLQIAWGSQASVGTTAITVSFPQPFKNAPICANSTTSNNVIVNIYDVSTTAFKTHVGTGSGTTYVRWIAVGSWK